MYFYHQGLSLTLVFLVMAPLSAQQAKQPSPTLEKELVEYMIEVENSGDDGRPANAKRKDAEQKTSRMLKGIRAFAPDFLHVSAMNDARLKHDAEIEDRLTRIDKGEKLYDPHEVFSGPYIQSMLLERKHLGRSPSRLAFLAQLIDYNLDQLPANNAESRRLRQEFNAFTKEYLKAVGNSGDTSKIVSDTVAKSRKSYPNFLKASTTYEKYLSENKDIPGLELAIDFAMEDSLPGPIPTGLQRLLQDHKDEKLSSVRSVLMLELIIAVKATYWNSLGS